MTTVQLPGADTNDSHMVIHTKMSKTDIGLATVFQKNPSDPTRSHGLIDHVINRKRASKRKWLEHEYCVQGKKIYNKNN